MTFRKWLMTAALGTGLSLGAVMPAYSADPKPEYTFGNLRPATESDARAKCEAWLKSTGKAFDTTAFANIWTDKETGVLDKTLAALELGSPEVKAVLASARNAAVVAPKEVPAFLKDEKLNAFVRANVALGFARGLTNGRVYEESLEALKLVKAEQTVEPFSYFFHRAVAEHALVKRDDAVRSVTRLLDECDGAPDRYKMLATIMVIDIGTWKKDEKDLANIKRLMDNSERRLGQARAGKVTQDIQKKIVFRLDELIKEKENQAKGPG